MSRAFVTGNDTVVLAPHTPPRDVSPGGLAAWEADLNARLAAYEQRANPTPGVDSPTTTKENR